MFASTSRLGFRKGLGIAQRRLATTLVRRFNPAAVSVCFGSAVALTAAVVVGFPTTTSITMLDANIPSSGDVIMLEPVKEKSTGILFPKLCNGLNLCGTGVRIKYGLVKVYAVGSYFDPTAMAAIKSQPKEAIAKALLNPMYPRTIRIVMARGLSIQKFTDALNEALKPRMNGEDLDKLDEFKKLNPPVDLVKGAEMELTIRGDTLLYKNAVGSVGMIRSHAFTKALCDVYYGDDPVSPTHKESVLEGIPQL